MPDQERSNEISQPTPPNANEGWGNWTRFVSFAIVIGGGVAAFAVMTAPTHVRGATASARLKWQQSGSAPETEAAPGAASANGADSSCAPDAAAAPPAQPQQP